MLLRKDVSRARMSLKDFGREEVENGIARRFMKIFRKDLKHWQGLKYSATDTIWSFYSMITTQYV